MGPRRARHARPEAGPARGCARLRSRRQAEPPLPSAARRSHQRASGRGASRSIDAQPQARVEQGLTGKRAKRGRRSLPYAPSPSIGQEITGKAARSHPGQDRCSPCPKPEKLSAGFLEARQAMGPSRRAHDLAPVAGDVERSHCDGGDQQQAEQRRDRWQDQEVHHCLWCSRRRRARFTR